MGLPNSWMFYKGKSGKIPLKLMITRATPILGNLRVHIYIYICMLYTLYIYMYVIYIIYICILYTLYICTVYIYSS